jgi:hypothetical protein
MGNVEDVASFFQETKIGRALCSYLTIALNSPLKRVFWHVKVGDVDCDNKWIA